MLASRACAFAHRCIYFLCTTCGYFQRFIFELNWIFFSISCRLCSSIAHKCATEHFICFSFIPYTHHMQRSKLHPHIYLDLSFFSFFSSFPLSLCLAWPTLTASHTVNAVQHSFICRQMKIFLCLCVAS